MEKTTEMGTLSLTPKGIALACAQKLGWLPKPTEEGWDTSSFDAFWDALTKVCDVTFKEKGQGGQAA